MDKPARTENVEAAPKLGAVAACATGAAMRMHSIAGTHPILKNNFIRIKKFSEPIPCKGYQKINYVSIISYVRISSFMK